MSRSISYKFKGQSKKIPFSYDKFLDMYEAVAAAEGIDLTNFLQMEQQVAMTAKRKAAMKDYRQQEFKRFGFSDIYLHKDEPEAG
jgi:hypothetical protein